VVCGVVLAGSLGVATAGAAASSQPGATTKPRTMFVVAHRGDTENAPESTLDAFGKAIDKGVDGIEFDVRYTADGVAVALHDDKVNRTTNCQGLIAELTFAIVQQCAAKDFLGRLFKDDTIPTVQQSLVYIHDKSPRVVVFLHLKTAVSQAQANALWATTKNTGMTKRAMYFSEKGRESHLMRLAGCPKLEIGRMAHVARDYRRHYAFLIAYGPDVTADLIGPALAAGRTVYPVETVPASLETIVAAGSTAVFLNHIDEGMAYLRSRHLHK
jgi:glycerophosphoryl diester phosphodiesterase